MTAPVAHSCVSARGRHGGSPGYIIFPPFAGKLQQPRKWATHTHCTATLRLLAWRRSRWLRGCADTTWRQLAMVSWSWWAKGSSTEQPSPTPDATADVEDGQKRCRFCFSGEGSVVQSQELLKLQCACTDSDLAYAHPSCARQWFLVQRMCDGAFPSRGAPPWAAQWLTRCCTHKVCEVCKEKAVDLDPEALAQAVKNAVARREAAARHRQMRNGQRHVMVPISLAVLAMPPVDEVVEPQPCVTWAWCPNAFLKSSFNERQAARSTICLLSVVLGLGLAVLIVNQT
jgi:hypothetical protein